MERLSSGLRINKASDDSAGSAISTRMSNQIQGMKQANENAQQANNLIQTAESGLNDISGMLSRMRELAVQASTDTLNDTDRASIDLEYQALKSEITRIANVTEYNEMDILNGTHYRNQVNADNSTTDDVTGVSVNNLSNDIRKGVYTLSDEAFRISGPADISNFSSTAITNINYDASVQPGSYTLSVTEATTTVNSDALQFDGMDDYISFDHDTIQSMMGENWAYEKTISAWIKPEGSPPTISGAWNGQAGYGQVSGSGNYFGISRGVIGGEDRIWVYNWDGNDDRIGVEYETSEWVHITLVQGSGKLYGYKNGELVGEVNTGASGNAGYQKIGGGTDNGRFFQGSIDEVGLWNEALTATEISALYNSGSGLDASSLPSSSNLQGYWGFNETSGATATDLSGNDNHGTLLNGPTQTMRPSGLTTTHTLTVTDPNTTTSEIADLDFSGQGLISGQGLSVDTSDASTMTSELSSPETFTVPETRRLTITDENGVQQSLQYQVGIDNPLDFSEFGIELDIAGNYSGGLDGTQIEISPDRDLQVGADNDANHQLKLGISSVTDSGLRINNSKVDDIDQARAAITSLDHATDIVNQERSYLGSMQNRLAFTMSNLTSQTQNIEASHSSIQDTDFAADATELAKNQILAQSATAMLAQASAISQNILSLISA